MAPFLVACQAKTPEPAVTEQQQSVTTTQTPVVSTQQPPAPAQTPVTTPSKPAITTPPPAAAQTTGDTIRGTFVLQGPDPMPMAVLRTAGGRVLLDDAPAGMLKLSQLELWVRGTRTSANRFRVIDYRVRGANGAKAWDGVLRNGVVGFNLELADGSSHAVRGAPGNFAQHIGARIWVTENPDGSLRAYGVL